MSYEYPEIKGAMASWANVTCALLIYEGETFKTRDFAAIDWDQGLEPSGVPGTGPMEVGRTTGLYKKNASMSMYLARAFDFQKALQATRPGVGFMQIPFDLSLQWEPIDGDGLVHSVKLVACRIMNESNKNAPSGDATVLEMPLSISHVVKYHPDGTELRAV